MNYSKEFKVTPQQVKREVEQIKKEKREYDEYGVAVYFSKIKHGRIN